MIKVFKKLNKGVKRSIIAGNVLGALGFGAIYNILAWGRITEHYFFHVLVSAIPTVIVLTFVSLWIYDGFKK